MDFIVKPKNITRENFSTFGDFYNHESLLGAGMRQ